jgi:hypothetical protein
MRWQVEVSDLSGDRRLLSDVLKELSLTLQEGEGKLLLSGPILESMDTPSEVHAYVLRVSEIAKEVGAHSPSIGLEFSVGAVIQQTGSGVSRHHFLQVSDTIHLHVAGHVAVLRCEPAVKPSEEELRRQEELLKERQYQELRVSAVARLVSAVREERALTVQRLLNQAPTPQILGHVADIIKDDLGSDLQSLASKNQLTRFYRSINHPSVFGESARHIVSHQEAPPAPMNLAEATAFIREVARSWLNLKSGAKDA